MHLSDARRDLLSTASKMTSDLPHGAPVIAEVALCVAELLCRTLLHDKISNRGVHAHTDICLDMCKIAKLFSGVVQSPAPRNLHRKPSPLRLSASRGSRPEAGDAATHESGSGSVAKRGLQAWALPAGGPVGGIFHRLPHFSSPSQPS